MLTISLSKQGKHDTHGNKETQGLNRVKTRGTVGVALVAVVFYLGLIGWRAVQLLERCN